MIEAFLRARQENGVLDDIQLTGLYRRSALSMAPTREIQQQLLLEYRGNCFLDACRNGQSQRVVLVGIFSENILEESWLMIR